VAKCKRWENLQKMRIFKVGKHAVRESCQLGVFARRESLQCEKACKVGKLALRESFLAGSVCKVGEPF
jgi:hypothetical protein